MNGPVPVFAMRDQAIAPRFDSRPAWWIFREILRRTDIKEAREALDFETIEELSNYQLMAPASRSPRCARLVSSSWRRHRR